MSGLTTTPSGKPVNVSASAPREIEKKKTGWVIVIYDKDGNVVEQIEIPLGEPTPEKPDPRVTYPIPGPCEPGAKFSADFIPIGYKLRVGDRADVLLSFPDSNTVTNRRGSFRIDNTGVASVLGIREMNGDCYRARLTGRSLGRAKLTWTSAYSGVGFTANVIVVTDMPAPAPTGSGIVGSGWNKRYAFGGLASGHSQSLSVSDLGVGPSVKLAAGYGASAFIGTDGRLFGTGSNSLFGFYNDDPLHYWGLVDPGNTYLDVAIGITHNPINASGSYPQDWLLAVRGDGRLLRSSGPGGVNADFGLGLVPVGTGEYASCCCARQTAYALRPDGTAQAWGDNRSGQAGIGYRSAFLSEFRDMKTSARFQKLCAGGELESFVAGLDLDGHPWSCGRNSLGALGLGESKEALVMTKINDGVYIDIAAGMDSLYLLRPDGVIEACGSGYWGQLGTGQSGYDEDGNEYHVTAPTPIEDGDTYQAIFSSWDPSLFAINTQGFLKACGRNDENQLGLLNPGDEGFDIQFFAIVDPETIQTYPVLTRVGSGQYTHAVGGCKFMLAQKEMEG